MEDGSMSEDIKRISRGYYSTECINPLMVKDDG